MECVVHNGKECSAGSDIIYLLVCHVPMEEIDYFVDAISPYDEGEDDNDTDDSELYDEDREGSKRMRGFNESLDDLKYLVGHKQTTQGGRRRKPRFSLMI